METNERIQYQCPNCGKILSIRKEYAGQQGRCNSCGNMIVVPVIEQSTPVTGHSQYNVKEVSDKVKDIAKQGVDVVKKKIDEAGGIEGIRTKTQDITKQGVDIAKNKFEEAGGVEGIKTKSNMVLTEIKKGFVSDEGASGLKKITSRFGNLWKSGKTGKVMVIIVVLFVLFLFKNLTDTETNKIINTNKNISFAGIELSDNLETVIEKLENNDMLVAEDGLVNAEFHIEDFSEAAKIFAIDYPASDLRCITFREECKPPIGFISFYFLAKPRDLMDNRFNEEKITRHNKPLSELSREEKIRLYSNQCDRFIGFRFNVDNEYTEDSKNHSGKNLFFDKLVGQYGNPNISEIPINFLGEVTDVIGGYAYEWFSENETIEVIDTGQEYYPFKYMNANLISKLETKHKNEDTAKKYNDEKAQKETLDAI